jgi:hypothetical protein
MTRIQSGFGVRKGKEAGANVHPADPTSGESTEEESTAPPVHDTNEQMEFNFTPTKKQVTLGQHVNEEMNPKN